MAATGWVGPPSENLAFVYAELKAALALQMRELADLEEKATRLLTPVGVVLGFGVGLLGHLGPSRVAEGLVYAGLLVLLASFVAGVYSLRVCSFTYAPTAALWPDYVTLLPEELVAVTSATVARAISTNANLRDRKSPWVRTQFWTLLLGAPLLAVGLACQVAGILA